ncbi:MAG: GNAT family N-acetyltransferase [Butyricicoccus sp.]|nr:GNAT family N-acetyltransferase [Butyricicoccus sp.]
MIRKATENDIGRVVEIYENIFRAQERGELGTGWVRGIYPSRETALEALERGELFVLVDGGVVAASARINRSQGEEYRRAAWKTEAPDERVMVLHTLAVDPALRGRGYGPRFVDFYEKYALERGCPCLRMDTNERNALARRLYARLGYAEADIVPCVFNGIPDVNLVCLEKTLL